MVKAEEKREINNPSELLHRLVISKFPIDDEESIELSLGLSLNGRFGVDPIRAKILNRSSSVSDFVSKNEESNMACVGPPLIRTCSLPTESEEEWRKRKEIQSLRRMEAKKKRIEKLRNGRNQSDFGENFLKSQRKVVGIIPSIPSLQWSIGSRGSGSSGTSESGSQPNQGMTGCNETISPASVQSPPKQGEQKPVLTPPTESSEFAAIENPSVNNAEANEIMRNMMVDMPCVSTRVAGPNGKRVEGFLYRYRKGEQVRIVCVCHGSFLTPAEFVKHGGGGDVSHPLKHIVVNPSPLL